MCVCLASSRHKHMAASSLDSKPGHATCITRYPRDLPLFSFSLINPPHSDRPPPPSPLTRTTTAPPPIRAEPTHPHTTTATATTSRRDYRRRKNTILQSVLEVIGNHSDSAKLYWKVRVMLLKTVRVLLIYKDLYSHLYHELY